ncbi:MAG TPA: nucleoside hydrolase [Methanocorpusculum sp.]|nr:nucleoside hydrolase [Methanocorpusculum sp.]
MSKKNCVVAGILAVLLILCIAGAGCTSVGNQPASTETYIVLDTDPGTDDAISYLLSTVSHLPVSNSWDDGMIVGTAGNVPQNQVRTNILLLHDYLDSPTSMALGASTRLNGEPIYSDGFCGPDGLGNQSVAFKEHMQEKYGLTAEEVEEYLNSTEFDFDTIEEIGNELMRHDHITYVTIGPQTTFALLLQQYPDLVSKIDRVYVMGGGFNISNAPHDAEFNLAGDPEADAIVFGSGLNITLLPLDLTMTCILTEQDIQMYEEVGKYKEMIGILEYGLNAAIEFNESDGFMLNDPVAVICALSPDEFLYEDSYVTIDEYGATRKAETGYPVKIAKDVNREAINNVMDWVFGVDNLWSESIPEASDTSET